MHQTSCSSGVNTGLQQHRMRSCQEPKRVPIPCGFSGAGSPQHHIKVILGCVLMAFVLPLLYNPHSSIIHILHIYMHNTFTGGTIRGNIFMKNTTLVVFFISMIPLWWYSMKAIKCCMSLLSVCVCLFHSYVVVPAALFQLGSAYTLLSCIICILTTIVVSVACVCIISVVFLILTYLSRLNTGHVLSAITLVRWNLKRGTPFQFTFHQRYSS